MVDERMKPSTSFPFKQAAIPLVDICEQVGINNKSYFYRLLKSIMVIFPPITENKEFKKAYITRYKLFWENFSLFTLGDYFS
ncbi:hypothetical protein N568_0102000 [Lactococcus garvieae TRF1]|uniref:Uncharacterized protein n=1 Tax=Lactococcus garvieae TRF1 TaxID=1380772 RepID=V8ARP7_9LACT|nr:hypothetical protein N568_0102000 [Lactococcus garvieae TRF1]